MASLVIYKALCFDVAQGRMNGAPNETKWQVYNGFWFIKICLFMFFFTFSFLSVTFISLT